MSDRQPVTGEEMDKLAAQAADPATPLTTLQSLAQDYPALRPAIALNPSTYPALLTWLGDLGDPAVDAALVERRAKAAPPAEPTVTSAVTSQPAAADTAAETVAEPPAESTSETPSETTAEPAPEAAGENAGEVASETADEPANDAAAETATPAAAASQRRNTRGLMAAVGGALLVAAVAIGVAVGFGGAKGDDGTFRYNDGKAPLVTTTAPDGGAQAQVATPSQEAQASTAPDSGKSKPEESATPSQSPSPTTSSPAPNPLAAPAGSFAVNSFLTADGSVLCQFASGRVSCHANTSPPQGGCAAGSSQPAYRLTLGAGHTVMAECTQAHGTEADGVLPAGASAVGGDYACTVKSDGVTVRCWNTKSGEGFDLGTSGTIRWDSDKTLPQ